MVFRSKLNVLVGLLAGLVLVGTLMLTLGMPRTWDLWRVPAGMVSFMDLRVVTAGAQSHREGFDPMYQNPHDFIQRLVNYPRLWQAAYAFPIDESDTVWLAAVVLALFFSALFLALPPMSNGRVGVLLLAVFSPAMMLGYERGNTDLVVFAVLALAVAAQRNALTYVLVMAAFALKLFPFAALAVLLGFERRAALRWAGWSLAFAVFYAAFYFDDLRQIVATTPRGVWLSFGRDVLSLRLAADQSEWVRAVSWGGLAAAAGWIAFALGSWWRGGGNEVGPDNAGMRGFRVGAACFVGTFLIGTNFAYKLVFLLLALPQLLEWAGQSGGRWRWPARIAVAGVYLALWLPALEKPGADPRAARGVDFWVGQAAHWVLFGVLVWLLVQTAPGWLREWGRRGEARRAAA